MVSNLIFLSTKPRVLRSRRRALARNVAMHCTLPMPHEQKQSPILPPPLPVLSSKTIFHFRSHHNHIYTHISMFTMLPQAAMNWKFSARTFLPLRVSRSVVSPFPSPVFNVWFAAPFTYNFLVVQCVCVCLCGLKRVVREKRERARKPYHRPINAQWIGCCVAMTTTTTIVPMTCQSFPLLVPGERCGKMFPMGFPPLSAPQCTGERERGFGYYRDVLRMIKLTYYFFPFDSRSHTQAQEVVDWKRNRAEDFFPTRKATSSTPPLAIETVGARPYGKICAISISTISELNGQRLQRTRR